MTIIRKILRDRRGTTGAEYSIMAALIAVAAMAAYHNVGNSVETSFNNVGEKVGSSL